MDEHNTTRHSVDDYYPKPDPAPDYMDSGNSEPEPDYRSRDNSGTYQYNQESSGADQNTYDSYSQTSQEWITCPKCGSRIPAASNFCNLCGYRFENSQEIPFPLHDVRIDGYLVDDIANFVAVNYQPYLVKFQKVTSGKFSFNWAAAIFSSRWLAYRGMFRHAFFLTLIFGAISTVVSFFISLILYRADVSAITQSSLNQINMLFYALYIGLGLICGILGDSFYWKYTKRYLDRFRCQGREAVSNLKLARSLKAAGGYRVGYLGLIILFDLTYSEALSSLMIYFLERVA